MVGKTETRKRRWLVGNLSLYRFLFEQSPNVNVVIGLDGLIKDVNNRWLKELGYGKKEVVGRPALDFVVPGDKAKVAAQLEKDLRGEPTPQLEVTVHAKDGSTRTILFSPGQLLLRRGGKPSAVLVTGLDITERKRLEDALQKSESRHRRLAESVTDIFFAMDAELRYTYWNKASEEFTGIKAEDALGKSIFDLFPDNEETRRIVAVYQEVLKTRQPRNFVSQYVRKGKTYFFDINVYPLEDGILVLARNVTELKSAEVELRSAKEELQLIYDNLQDNVTFLDNGFRVLRVNRPDDIVFGLKRKEMLGRKCFEVLGDPSVKGPCPECPVKQALETGRPTRSSRWRRDGRFIDLTAIPIRGPDGQVSRVVEIGRDLTELKEAEERLQKYSQDLERMVEERTRKLRESHRFLETVLDSIPEPVFIKDRDFRYVMLNLQAAISLRRSKEEILGRTDYDIHPKEEADFFKKGDLEVLEKGITVEISEEKATGKDGVTRLFHVKKAPIKNDDGEVTYIVGVSRDITDLKRLEKELERSRDEVKRLNESLTLSLMRSSKLLTEVSNLREELRKAPDASAGLKMILNSALTNLNGEMGVVLMLDFTGERVRARVFRALFEGFTLNGEYPLKSKYVEFEALERRKPVSRILQPGESSILGARSLNCAPIYVGGEARGVLALGSRSAQVLQEIELHILEEYGGLVASVLESERLKVTPSLEEAAAEALETRFRLEPASSYLVLGDVEKAYEIFMDQVRGGHHGLCVTRAYPPLVRRQYGLERTPLVWLSEEKVEDEQTVFSLQDLSIIFNQFLESAEKAVILLDGFEYLIVNHGFEPFIHFLQLQRSRIERTGGVLIAPLIPEALGLRELKLIEREMKPLKL